MKVYLSISEEYFNYSEIYKILNKIGIDTVIINNVILDEHLENLRGKLILEIVKKGELYNVIREDVDLVLIATDGEDKKSIYLTKFCINHRIPILLLTNIIDNDTLLEVV